MGGPDKHQHGSLARYHMAAFDHVQAFDLTGDNMMDRKLKMTGLRCKCCVATSASVLQVNGTAKSSVFTNEAISGLRL